MTLVEFKYLEIGDKFRVLPTENIPSIKVSSEHYTMTDIDGIFPIEPDTKVIPEHTTRSNT